MRGARVAKGFDESDWLGIALVAILALLVLPPLFILVRTSFVEFKQGFETGGLTFQHYVNLLSGNRLAASAVNSVIFASAATIVSLLFGGALAWLVERTDSAIQAAGVPDLGHFTRHAIHSLCDRLAFSSRKIRAVQSGLAGFDRPAGQPH